MRRLPTTSLCLAACLTVVAEAGLFAAARSEAQPPAREAAPAAPTAVTAPLAEPSDRSAPVVFMNRPIAVLRARVLGRGPLERADSAQRALEELASQHLTGPVEWRSFDGGAILTVATRGVLGLTRADVDELSGESFDAALTRTAERTRRALEESVEARSLRTMVRAAAVASAALLLAAAVIWVVMRARATFVRAISRVAARSATRRGIASPAALRALRLIDVTRWTGTALAMAVDLVIVYATIGFVLRRFPFTRPWGESMRAFVLTNLEQLGLAAARAIPGLFMIGIIVVLTRIAARLVGHWFAAIERGQLTPRWIYPETAQPTRRLLIGLLWVFAIVVAYPYVPGSQTEAFKGISVFFGLMVTFGSSGLVNQIMSGLVITYSRALRVGDFVRIGDVEGTVTYLGVLSTKVTTLWREEATIPNAVVVSQTTTDYSRFAGGAFIPTSVTIGYDAPWRQVQALLLLAAERTPGLRREPAPFVIQAGLEDFYVKYTLFVCLEQQESRPYTFHTLHAHIQDLFNEYGVQIMSPHYVIDPAAQKIVPRREWFAAPARPDAAVDTRTG